MSMFDLRGRSALVTGGSKGIGEAIAEALAGAGADVMLCARNAVELEAAANRIKTKHAVKVETSVTDMSDRDQADALANAALERLGKVDIVFNNAGSNTPQTLDELKDETWDHLVELNMSSCVRLTRALVPGMRERGWGRVVYIASVMGSVGIAGRTAYCATKAGLIGLTHAQAVELGPHGVTVNCISPGPILTDLPKSALSKEKRAHFANATALTRWGEPYEVAGPALLLASDAGSYVTGANLLVDGGVTIKAM